MDHRPASQRGDADHPGIGVDRPRVSHDREQRNVVVAVGVGVAGVEIDPGPVRPLGDRPRLAATPDELTVDGAVVVPGSAAVAGGDHLVEAERLGEGTHQVLGGRRREHEDPALLAVLLDHLLGVGQHRLGATARRHALRLADQVDRPAPCSTCALACDEHRRPRLADQVEHAERERLERAGGDAEEADVTQRLADDRSACSRQQRPVEVEDRCGPSSLGRDLRSHVRGGSLAAMPARYRSAGPICPCPRRSQPPARRGQAARNGRRTGGGTSPSAFAPNGPGGVIRWRLLERDLGEGPHPRRVLL